MSSISSIVPISGAALTDHHDYSRLASSGGGGGHISIEMGDRRVSDVSDDTL
jgi:hypothetical protein